MNRVALFAHYDSQAEVKPYVVTFLRGLREVCNEIVFVSTAALPDRELERVRPICGRSFATTSATILHVAARAFLRPLGRR